MKYLITKAVFSGYLLCSTVLCIATEEVSRVAKRRANGEGNIRKRKDGRWEGRYTAGHDPETGRAIYRNVLGRTQTEARAKLKAAMEAAKNIDRVKAKKYTVGKWMDE